MHQLYEDYLFSQGCLVADSDTTEANAAEALLALAHYANIRITAHAELANLHMLEVAARNLGCNVPQPFYRGFPKTARKLAPEQLLFDQLSHYITTYGRGDFSQAGHSLFEESYERVAFAENAQPKLYAIITKQEADERLARMAKGFLASTRPLSDANFALLARYLRDQDAVPSYCASKDTACRLLLSLRDPNLASLLVLPDVIRLLEWMLESSYADTRLNKLNLKNRDRKLLTAVLDRLFERGAFSTMACLEKRRTWCGLLHHLHYRPRCDAAREFCHAVRTHQERSAYAEFERLMAGGRVIEAADALRASKGQTAVLRNLCYLLSRCSNGDEVSHILQAATTTNKIALVQLIQHLYLHYGSRPRTFRFVHLNKMRRHAETELEQSHRKSQLDANVSMQALLFFGDALAKSCFGTLGKVYADRSLRSIALPLQEAASQGGVGTLPRGSRLPLPTGKKLRAFVYWELVDDIDLSCIGLDEKGTATEFSWRTMAGMQSAGITYSGDQTSGYHGGSEYFDVDLPAFRGQYPECRYLVFCANVYSYGTFASCTCRAGYMLRDTDDTGEVFEPKTVQSSFTVNCGSSMAHLFALDLIENAFVWLNVAENGYRSVAGTGNMAFLLDYMSITNAMNLYEFACLLASKTVSTLQEADVVFSDAEVDLHEGQEQIHSYDTARIFELLNA
ncbi:MAG: TerD family protein [Atopobiaceae bacterium]|nr:TerD family protein [Atopobiaceae bacterium]